MRTTLLRDALSTELLKCWARSPLQRLKAKGKRRPETIALRDADGCQRGGDPSQDAEQKGCRNAVDGMMSCLTAFFVSTHAEDAARRVYVMLHQLWNRLGIVGAGSHSTSEVSEALPNASQLGWRRVCSQIRFSSTVVLQKGMPGGRHEVA